MQFRKRRVSLIERLDRRVLMSITNTGDDDGFVWGVRDPVGVDVAVNARGDYTAAYWSEDVRGVGDETTRSTRIGAIHVRPATQTRDYYSDTLPAGQTPGFLYPGFGAAGEGAIAVHDPETDSTYYTRFTDSSAYGLPAPYPIDSPFVADVATDEAGNTYWLVRVGPALHLQKYSPALEPLDTLVVDDAMNTSPYTPFSGDVAIDPASNALSVAYEKRSADGFGSSTLWLRAFTASGTPVANAARVDVSSGAGVTETSVAIDAAGRSYVTWADEFGAVFLRRFDAGGAPIGAPSAALGQRDALDTAGVGGALHVVTNAAGDHVVLFQSGDSIVAKQFRQDGSSVVGDDFVTRGRYDQGVNGYRTDLGNGAYSFTPTSGFGAAMTPDGQLFLATTVVDYDEQTPSADSGREVVVQRYDFRVDGPTQVIGGAYNVNDTSGPSFKIVLNDDVGASLPANPVYVYDRYTYAELDRAAYASTYDAATRTITVRFKGAMLPAANYSLSIGEGSLSGTTRGANTAWFGQFDFLPGDANGDRRVNFDDLLVLARNYGSGGRSFAQGNFDYSADGKVDFADLLLLARRYGSSLPQPASLAVQQVTQTDARSATRRPHGRPIDEVAIA